MQTQPLATLSQLPGCPSWCPGEHDGMMRGETAHERGIGETFAAPQFVGQPLVPARVWIVCFDDAQGDAVTRTAPEIHVDELQLSIEHARELRDLLDQALAAVDAEPTGSKAVRRPVRAASAA